VNPELYDRLNTELKEAEDLFCDMFKTAAMTQMVRGALQYKKVGDVWGIFYAISEESFEPMLNTSIVVRCEIAAVLPELWRQCELADAELASRIATAIQFVSEFRKKRTR